MAERRPDAFDEQANVEQPSDDDQPPPKPSSRARMSIILIGVVTLGSMGCMCAFVALFAAT